jgi:hypothetical protein
MMNKLIFWTIILTLLIYAPNSSAATISGTVIYEGEIPNLKPIKMDADPICMSKHSDVVIPQSLVLGEGQTMGNVFVHVKSGIPKKDFPPPSDPVEITQEGCMYAPHVLGVMVGQPIKILNPDGTLHNIHALSKINQEFNLAMPKFRKEITKTFDKAEFMFAVKWMVNFPLLNSPLGHTRLKPGMKSWGLGVPR